MRIYEIKKRDPSKEPIIQFILVNILSPICVDLEWLDATVFYFAPFLHPYIDTTYLDLLLFVEVKAPLSSSHWELFHFNLAN